MPGPRAPAPETPPAIRISPPARPRAPRRRRAAGLRPRPPTAPRRCPGAGRGPWRCPPPGSGSPIASRRRRRNAWRRTRRGPSPRRDARLRVRGPGRTGIPSELFRMSIGLQPRPESYPSLGRASRRPTRCCDAARLPRPPHSQHSGIQPSRHSCAQLGPEQRGELRSLALVLVLEVDEGVTPGVPLVGHVLGPAREVGLGVAFVSPCPVDQRPMERFRNGASVHCRTKSE